MSIMRAARWRSTLLSLIEVAVFFIIITPLFFLLCYGVYHAIHGPVSRDNSRTTMAEAMTTAQQASERVPEVASEAEVIEKDEKLADAILDLSTALSTASDDPARTAQSFRRVADAARRKARNDADAFEEAEEYADSTAKTAAETLLADVLDRATTLHLAAAQAKAEAEKLKTISGEIRTAHEEALTEARKTIEETDDPTEKADAQQLIADLEPLLEELTEMFEAFEAVEPVGKELAELTDNAQEGVRDVIKETVEAAQEAGKQAGHATELMIANRFDTWADIAATSVKVQETAAKVEDLSARAAELADAAYLRLNDRLGPGAKDFVWQIKRAEVAAARATRRSARTIERCRKVRSPLLAPKGFEAPQVDIPAVEGHSARRGLLSLLTLGELFGSMPWWMWVIEGALYLLLVNGYWISGDSDLDRCEVRAFGAFALIVAAVLVVVHWRAIVGQIDAFLSIVGGQG